MYRKVCLVGFDRVVGSFALGLKRIGFHGTIVGVADGPTISQCWKLGLIHDGFQDLAKGMAGADLVMLSSRSAYGGVQLGDVVKIADGRATISEMTRVKGDVNRVFETEKRNNVHYVGFRLLGDNGVDTPVSESSRFFFEGKSVILTPRGKDDLDMFAVLQDVMTRMGADIVAMSPQAHDRLLAQMTQIPMTGLFAILQGILKSSTEYKITPEMLGSRMMDEIRDLDIVRQSGWVDDLTANRELVLQGLDELLVRLRQVREDLATGRIEKDLDAVMERASVVLDFDRSGEKPDLVLVSGQDVRTLQRASELMAIARIPVGNIQQMEHAEAGTYRVSLRSLEARTHALNLLRQAGMHVESLE